MSGMCEVSDVPHASSVTDSYPAACTELPCPTEICGWKSRARLLWEGLRQENCSRQERCITTQRTSGPDLEQYYRSVASLYLANIFLIDLYTCRYVQIRLVPATRIRGPERQG